MADSTNKIETIYSIRLDLEATNEALKQYGNTVGQIAKNTGEMNATLKDQQSMMANEEKARKKTKEVIDAEVGSIRALREENKRLTEVRNNTTVATEEGRKKVEALNRQLNENNKTIKQNVDAYTKQKIGIGDYSGALDKLVPGLGATMNGLQGVGKAMMGLVTNPLGATLIGLGLAFGALMKYFTGSEEGQNRLNAIMAVGGALMEKIWDIVEGFGEAMYNAFTNPQKALEELWKMIKNNLINRFTALAVIIEGIVDLDFKKVANGVLQLGTGVEDVIGKTQKLGEEVVKTFNTAIDQGSKLAALQAKIDKDERAMLVEREKVRQDVLKLRTRAIEEEGEVKKATIKEAIALEEALADKEVQAAKTRRDQAKLRKELNGDDKQAKLELARAEADLIAAETSRFENTLKLRKELEALDDAEREKKAKQAEDDKKKLDAEEEQARKDEEADAEWEKKLKDKKAKDDEKRAKDLANTEKKIEELKSGGITTLVNKTLGARLDANKLYNSVFKKGALSETYVNTKAAATAAFKAMSGIPIVGPLLGIAAAAAAIAFGLEQAAGIQAIPFARGGRVLSGTRIMAHHGQPIRRANGDNRLATVRVGETVVTEAQRARLGGEAAFRRAGIPGYATGGQIMELGQDVETRIASNAADQNAILSIVDTIVTRAQPILVMQDYEYAQFVRDQTAARAKVL